ncbi:S8 family serine peptidase [bacterium]|nr:S8 family serine peptidase [bacterium]
MKTLALITFLVMLCCPAVPAGELSTEMRDSYWQNPDDYKKVIIVLANQASVEALNRDLLAAKLPLAERHRILLDSLQAHAERTQSAIQNSLEILTNAGLIRNSHPHWLANLIVCETTVAGAELLANIADVAEVGACEKIAVRALVTSEPAEAALLNVEAPLKTIRAPEAWAKGLYGKDRIICVLDQAVRLNHPALESRWRGNSSMTEQSLLTSDNLVEMCGNDRLEMLGTACGADPARGDTIGVAPLAEWIAGSLFCQKESDFDQLLTALEWAVDPDGQSSSFDDVPDVICMAWEAGKACQTYLPVGAWTVFRTVEILGPVCIFAAGNHGEQGAGSVGLPEGYAEIPDLNFSVGNLDDSSPTIKAHATSGRGPSPCDNKLIKPDLVAPGTKIRTAFGDGYIKATGTSVAAGYVAGTVALMREANPELTASDIRKILSDTAVDMGLSGKDNVYGFGLLNTAKAVETAKGLGSSGIIKGLVRYGGTPLDGASVELITAFGTSSARTLPNGAFSFDNLPTDREYRLRVARFGFAPFISEQPIVLEQNGEHSTLINLKASVYDNVEFDQGWIYGVTEDDATEGIWERAIPIPSSDKGQLIQVDTDVTVDGEYCFVTGNASSADDPAGTADVDGGQTTLRSPTFNLRELDEPELTFYYAYSNDKGGQKGGDFFRAQISNDGGATWTDLIRTSVSTNGWKEVSLKLNDFTSSTDNMILQFIADDRPPATLVEAAVDEIKITGKPGAPEPPRNLQIEVKGDDVHLVWRSSEGASKYTVYLSDNAHIVVLPKNYFTETSDTTLVIPLNDIPYNEFYFQVTASR